MVIVTQDKKNIIGDTFIVSCVNPMDTLDGTYNLVYTNFQNNRMATLGRFSRQEDCTNQLEILALCICDSENVKAGTPVLIKGSDNVCPINIATEEMIQKSREKMNGRTQK